MTTGRRLPPLRSVAARALLRALRTVSPELAGGAPAPPGSTARLTRERRPGRLRRDEGAASRELCDRLDDDDVAEIERLIDGDERLSAYYRSSNLTPAVRRHLILSFGIWLGVPAVAKTSLITAQPPEDVHAMARGPLSAAGGLFEADLVADALASVGADITDVRDALDFGSSSGRVVRVLAAAYPRASWRGCDPNRGAIEWARANIPGVEFFVSDDAPPLPLADGSLDLAYGISIWSHFAPALGRRWFEEMHRLIRPGGHLVCTTHGLTSVDYYVNQGLRSVHQSEAILGDLYRRGWWYAGEFGAAGDWGVINPDWGTAFLSPEWLLSELCPQWRVLEFAPGRNQENQDVYVLQRA